MSRAVVVECTPATWAAAWATRHDLQPILPLLLRLADKPGWPAVSRYRALLGAEVDFVTPTGRLPAGLDASDVDDSYIGRCLRGAVPTRPGNLHDLMNALTWAAFPRAKSALCRRQVEVARARAPATNRLRTRAQDLLAMLDEGGVVGADTGDTVILGHGLLEDLVLGRVSRGRALQTVSVADDDIATAIMTLPLPGGPPVSA